MSGNGLDHTTVSLLALLSLTLDVPNQGSASAQDPLKHFLSLLSPSTVGVHQ